MAFHGHVVYINRAVFGLPLGLEALSTDNGHGTCLGLKVVQLIFINLLPGTGTCFNALLIIGYATHAVTSMLRGSTVGILAINFQKYLFARLPILSLRRGRSLQLPAHARLEFKGQTWGRLRP